MPDVPPQRSSVRQTPPQQERRCRVSTPRHIGPPPSPGSTCARCGRPAAAKCDTCGLNLCGLDACWWKHSHTTKAAGFWERLDERYVATGGGE